MYSQGERLGYTFDWIQFMLFFHLKLVAHPSHRSDLKVVNMY